MQSLRATIAIVGGGCKCTFDTLANTVGSIEVNFFGVVGKKGSYYHQELRGCRCVRDVSGL